LALDTPFAAPAWSPDGTRIAFGSTTGCDPFEECDKAEIWVVRSEGGRPARLSRDRRVPSWSPDGRWLAWWDNIGLQAYGSLAIVWDAQTGRRRIVGRAERAPAWLPDGTLLTGGQVYDVVSGRSRRARPLEYGSRSPDGSYVALDDSAFEGVTEVVRAADGKRFRVSEWMRVHAWSPDGRRLAFIDGLPAKPKVSVVNADGTHRRKLRREHQAFEMSGPLVWAVGDLLVYSGRQRAQDTEILAISPDGQRLGQLTTNDVAEFEPAASPDGEGSRSSAATTKRSGRCARMARER
jgi:Tol biopolymer transport system component